VSVIAPEEFRRALGHFASGVTVVTTRDARERPTGLTVSAFAAVSLKPPLVLVCVDHKARTHAALCASGRFAVNVLTDHQEAVSRQFASTRPDKFDGVAHTVSSLGLPLIEGALVHLECVTLATHAAGDHTIFVGRVERAAVSAGTPLLSFRGRYHRLAGVDP
jgi:flavin reductase (DIM6/NTAB) family NADH-FMN oxidoreductase RutF